MNHANIDKVIERFYGFLPNGSNYSDSVYDFKFEHKEQQAILKFLVDNHILELWGVQGKHIITSKGEDIFTNFEGIEKYLKHEKEESALILRLEKLKNEKLHFDAKLSKWQAKTFWIVFTFGLIGGIHTFYSIIYSAIGESEEQKIERILKSKLPEQEQKHKTSTYQINTDTLSRDKAGEK